MHLREGELPSQPGSFCVSICLAFLPSLNALLRAILKPCRLRHWEVLNLWSCLISIPHFIHKETEAQRGKEGPGIRSVVSLTFRQTQAS